MLTPALASHLARAAERGLRQLAAIESAALVTDDIGQTKRDWANATTVASSVPVHASFQAGRDAVTAGRTEAARNGFVFLMKRDDVDSTMRFQWAGPFGTERLDITGPIEEAGPHLFRVPVRRAGRATL